MRLTAPLRIACSLADKGYVWAGIVDDGENVRILTAPAYVWAGHFRTGRIK